LFLTGWRFTFNLCVHSFLIHSAKSEIFFNSLNQDTFTYDKNYLTQSSRNKSLIHDNKQQQKTKLFFNHLFELQLFGPP